VALEKGKSMIALHVLDVLERTKGDSKTAVITPLWHFYDTQACLAHTTGGNTIRSLIYQLLRRYDDLFEYILPEFEIQREDLLHDSMFETQWFIFESIVHDATLPILNCVVDGLDECEPTSLEWLLIKLDKLFARTTPSHTPTIQGSTITLVSDATGKSFQEEPRPRLRVLVLSRAKTPPCLSILFRYKHLSLEDNWKDCEGGVARYVELGFKRIKLDLALKRRIEVFKPLDDADPLAQWNITETDPVKLMVDKAGGSYLWVQLNINCLKTYDPRSPFDRKVQNACVSLEKTYERMARGIRSHISQSQWLAARLLQWVFGAARPLRVEELAPLVDRTVFVDRATLGDRAQPPDWLPEVDLHGRIELCNHFLEIRDNCVVLCHSSVRDLFRQESTWGIYSCIGKLFQGAYYPRGYPRRPSSSTQAGAGIPNELASSSEPV
jgi:hypothetical protein